MVARPYQSEMVDAVFRQFDGGRRSTLVVAATGTGKTHVFGHVAERWFRDVPRGRVLVLAHREELVFQAKDRCESITGQQFEIEMGEFRASTGRMLHGSARGFCASVQSIYRANRLRHYHPDRNWLVVIDEAHHCTKKSKTYWPIVEHFQRNTAARVLGVTATPDRADEIALGEIFESVAAEYGVVDAINDGWLVPIRQRMVFVKGLDLRKVRTERGDLSESQLDEIITEEKVLHRIVSPTIKIAAGRPTLVFAPRVHSAEALAEVFNRHYERTGDRRVRAVALSGKTDRDERRAALKQFARGEFGVLVNCGLFLEGTDLPTVEVIAMARPTKSRALYSQMAGRGTRTVPGLVDAVPTADARRAAIAASVKPCLLIIDFVGNSGRHKLIHSADVLGGKYADDVVERAKQLAAAKGRGDLDSDTMAELEAAKTELEERRRKERRRIIAEAVYSEKEVDPFDLLEVSKGREPGYYRRKAATPKQIGWLRYHGIRNTKDLSCYRASQLIDAVVEREKTGRCNPQQASVLMRHGYDTNCSAGEAAKRIEEINRQLVN